MERMGGLGIGVYARVGAIIWATMKKPARSSPKSSTKQSAKGSSASKSRGSLPKGSRGKAAASAEFVETPTDQLPKWMQRRFKISARNLSALTKKRGKDLRVFNGLDMQGF